MNKSVWMKLGTVAVLIAVLVSAVAVVGAQTTADSSVRPGRGFGFGDGNTLTLVAEQLGITADELVSALQGGQTVADLATEKDVALSTIVDAVVAAHTETLAAAVTAGTLTQAQADARIALTRADLEASFSQTWTAGRGLGMGRGDGMGQGHGGMGRGHHGFGQMDANGDGICDPLQSTDPAATPEATVVPNS